MEIIELSHEFKEQFFNMVQDYENNGDKRYSDYKTEEGFEKFLRHLEDYKNGINIKQDHVPYANYWLINSEKIMVGSIRLRHALNEWTRNDGGHIGYDVSPSHRNKGYATYMLKEILKIAKKMGLDKVLITCSNIASEKVALKNGAVFDSKKYSQRIGRELSHYWITL